MRGGGWSDELKLTDAEMMEQTRLNEGNREWALYDFNDTGK